MIDFTVHTQITRTPAEVFAYVADPSKLVTWQTSTVAAELIGGGPMGLGARLREVHRAPGGRELESVVEVSEFEPGRALALRMVEGSLPLDAQMKFAPEGAGTNVAFRVTGKLTGLARLGQPFLRVVLKRQFSGHCATLRRVLEAG